MILLADVGGTNARFALAQGDVIRPDSVTRLRGDDHASFDDALKHYLRQQGLEQVRAVCVAVAGPVAGGQAKLTNRDWDFSEPRLMQLCGARKAVLINDLVALGYAVPGLAGDSVSTLRQAETVGASNGQSLVVNAGTGFNICAVHVSRSGRIACLEAEEGHTRLPQSILEHLQAALPAGSPGFHSVEDLLSGRGLVRLHQTRLAIQPDPDLRAEHIVAAADQGDAEAEATCRLYTRLLGLICRELAMRFLPRGGLYLAGSVARSCERRMDEFNFAFLSEPLMQQIPRTTPVRMIRDDMAAIRGCLAALM